MAKIRILCFLSLDGCLLDRRSLSVLCDSADKYGIGKIRKEATRHLEAPVSFVSLSKWKQEANRQQVFQERYLPPELQLCGVLASCCSLAPLLLNVRPLVNSVYSEYK